MRRKMTRIENDYEDGEQTVIREKRKEKSN